MAIKGSGSPMEAVDEYFDMLIKSRFNEMFGSVKGNEKGLKKSTLNTICHQIVDGSHNPSKGGNPSDYLMLSSKNVIDGSITHDNPRYLSKEDFDLEDKRTRVRPGDILMTIVGTIGRTAIVPKNAGNLTFQRSVAVLHIDHQQIDPVFLKSCLDSIQADIDAEAHGSSQKGIYLNQVEKIPVLVPDLSIQKKFSSFVQQVDKSKAIVQKYIDKYDLLVKSRFIEEFGAIDLSAQKPEWKEISSLGKILTGSTPKTNVPEYWDGEIKWIAPAELTSETFYVYDTERKITEEGRKSCSLNVLKPGVVLLSSRAPIGKVAIVGSEMYCNQGFKNIECGPELNNVYLYILLKYNTKYLDSLGRGATFKEISAKIVAGIRIPAPPRAQQDRFEEFIKQVDKSKFEVVQSLLRLKSKYIRTETPSKRTDCDL